jgi:TolB protein
MIACEAWFLKSEGVREMRGMTMLNVPDPSKPTILMREAQSKDIPLLSGIGNGVPSNPKWSPDGSRLMFQVMRPDHKSDLWVVNRDGTNAINLTKGVGDNTQAVWSPARPK